MSRRTRPLVPQELVTRIAAALELVDTRHAALDEAVAGGASLETRRALRKDLRTGFDEADALLREATTRTRPHAYGEWSKWRTRLSRLDMAKQFLLFEETDDIAVLGLGNVRAVDTGMAGPSIGELQHGRSKSPGTPARYGLDMEEVLAAPPRIRVVPRPVLAARPDVAVVLNLPASSPRFPADAA